MSIPHTFLITSGAYLSAEFISIFGRLPPSLLPVGTYPLYEHQAEWADQFEGRKIISLPRGFDLSKPDRDRLDQLGFEVHSVPPGIQLSASILHVLKSAGVEEGELRILHGDTLIAGFSNPALDIVAESTTTTYYSWAEVQKNDDGNNEFFDGLPSGEGNRKVLSGYFSFADSGQFILSLEQSSDNFIEALNLYSSALPLATVDDGTWLDFGHLDNYYRSKSHMAGPRSFNSLTFTRRTVQKSSINQKKMEAEAHWFESVPPRLKVYTPQYLGRTPEGDGYETEYLHLSTLSELFVHGRLPTYVWQRIFQSCDDFLCACREYSSGEEIVDPVDEMYLEKTTDRLSEYLSASGIDGSKEWRYNGNPLPSLVDIVQITSKRIPPASHKDLQIIHGDFCFSNIFFDFHSDAVRVVDPRGHLGHVGNGAPSIYGDVRYDIAKLYHSVIGGYDAIMAGRYKLDRMDQYAREIQLSDPYDAEATQRVFIERQFAGYTVEQSSAAEISILLFLSMLPLHNDRPDRQQAFLANALRLFKNLI